MANASVRTKKAVRRKKHPVETVKVKQTASTFAMIRKVVKTVQVSLGIYAFCNVLFWLAYTAKIAGQNGLYILFKPAWNIVSTFYTYKPMEGKEDIDFTGLVCSICIVVLVVILKSVHEYLGELEENAKIEDAKRLERAKKRAMALASGKAKAKVKNNSKNKTAGFVFLLDIEIKQVSGFIQSEALSPEEIAKIKTMFFKSLLNNLNMNQVAQKGYYKKRLFLQYKSINYLDDFIFYTRETLNSIAQEFIKPNMRIDFLVGLNLIGQMGDLKEKLDVLDTVNKLGLKNEFIATNALKDVYECLSKRTYQMISKGIYNLSKNLNVSNNQELFSIRE